MTDTKRQVSLIGLEDADAPLGVVSLPIPGDADYGVEVRGAKSQAVPVGFWPRSEQTPGGVRRTRRALVYFEVGAGDRPVVEFTPGAKGIDNGDSTGWSIEAVALENIARHADENYWHYYRQPGEVRLSYGGRRTAFSLAIDNEDGLHRWQFVQAQKLWGGPLVEAWRIGGHICTGDESPLTQEKLRELGNIIVCEDKTIAASIYLLLFANGTAQVTGHWINGRIYGGVGDQKGVPVVLFSGADLPEAAWDGSDGKVSAGDARINFAPSAHLVSPEHPGAFRHIDGESAWQIVESTRITIRHLPAEGGVSETDIPGSAEGLVAGASRTATWLMGLGDEEPRIGRFVAPPEWYAECSEFAPFPIEVKDGEFDRLGRVCAEALLRNSVSGRFTSGGIWRYLDQYGLGCYELSMDANEGRSLFRRAYRDSDARFFDLALLNSYFMADIATDASRDIIHYHGDNPGWRTYSLIYQRFSGMVLGYLETGDFYLLDTAKAVARNYMALHLQNWPRHGIGRDADPLTGFMTLYDYTGAEEFFEFAREFAHDVSLVIERDGVWLSGAGVGPQMGCNASAGSPWNGGHFLHGFTEYAMRDPNVPQEWLRAAGMALAKLYDDLRANDGYHPAATGFVGRIHWYLACRLRDRELMDATHELMGNLLKWAENPGDGRPVFTGPRGHHMNNYADNLIFYEATRDSLPEMLEGQN